jgi:hypothetical protein
MYYNLLEKIIIGVDLGDKEKLKYDENRETIDKMMGKIKNIGM